MFSSINVYIHFLFKEVCGPNSEFGFWIWKTEPNWKPMKKTEPLTTLRLTLQKLILPKSHQQNRPNSAKMLKKLCLINDDVTYCLVEKKLVKQSCGEVSVYSKPPPEGLSRPPLSKDWAILEISPERNYTTNAKVDFFTENVKNFLSAFYEPSSGLIYVCPDRR